MNQMTGKSRRILENVIKCRSPSRTLLVVKDVERPSPGANRIFTDLVKEARLNSVKHWPGFPQADMVANPIRADERKSGVTQNLKDKSGDLRTRAEELLRHKVGDVEDILDFHRRMFRSSCMNLQAHADLEQKVLDRTADLGLVNESLVLEIEERKRGQESLTRSNKDLEYLAYVASHDVQEPLRNVSSCLSLLERAYKEKLGSDADRLIEHAVQSVLRMKALFMDLLKLSRIATQGEAFGQTDCGEALSKSLMILDSAID